MLQRNDKSTNFDYEDWKRKRKVGQLNYIFKNFILVRGLSGIVICAIATWFMGWNKDPLNPVYLTIILAIGILTTISSIAAGILSWQRNEREYNKSQEM